MVKGFKDRSPPDPRDAGRVKRHLTGPPGVSARDNGLSPEDLAFVRALVIHDDPQVLGFNKPSGLPVQGGSGVTRSLDPMLVAFAKSNGNTPRLVHRLDRETSGVLVAARTKPAAALLSAAFAGRDARKTYLALVCGGAPEPRDGQIALALKKSARRGLDIMEIAADGQGALTRYRTLAASIDSALLELTPETGRMHQLRAHLSAIGRPIAGDGKYGGLFSLGGHAVPRLLLHAAALDLPHPAGGRLKLAAPIPPDFYEVIAALGFATALPPQS